MEKLAKVPKVTGSPQSPKLERAANNNQANLQVDRLIALSMLLKGQITHLVVSSHEHDTVYAVGSGESLVVRYNLAKKSVVCVSKSELTRADWIVEDYWGKLWVISFGNDNRVYKLNRELFLEEFYVIPTSNQIVVQPWASPCAVNRKKTEIYLPTGLHSNALLKIESEEPEGSKKTASLAPLNQVVHRKAISNMVLSCDDRFLIVDQGTRSIKVIDLHKLSSDFDHHIDNSKEKLSQVAASKKLADIVYFSGQDRQANSISVLKIIPGKHLEMVQTVTLLFQAPVQCLVLDSSLLQRLDKDKEDLMVFSKKGDVATITLDHRTKTQLELSSFTQIHSDTKKLDGLKSALLFDRHFLAVAQRCGTTEDPTIYHTKLN